MTRIVPTNTYGISQFVVSPDPSQGNFTTIQSAVNAASAGDTIYIADGIYNENVTLIPGIVLTSLTASGYNSNVSFTGSFTFTGGGIVAICNIEMVSTNGKSIIFSGTNPGDIILYSCYMRCTNNTSIYFTNTNANSTVTLYASFVIADTNLSTILISSSTGSISILSSYISNESFNYNPCSFLGTTLYVKDSIWATGLTFNNSVFICINSQISSLTAVLILANTNAEFFNSTITGNTNSIINNLFVIDATSVLTLIGTSINEAITGPSPNFSGNGTINIYSVYPIGTTVFNFGSNTVVYKNNYVANAIANSVTTPTFKTSPQASAASTLALGTAYQNTLGYDVLVTVYIDISNTTNANFLLGVGPTSTPTQQNILTNYNITPNSTHLVFPVPIYLPNNYYALLSTSGTVTATIIGQLAMPI